MVNSQKGRDNKLFERLNLSYCNFSLKPGFISEIYQTRAILFLTFQCDLCCKDFFQRKQKKFYKAKDLFVCRLKSASSV